MRIIPERIKQLFVSLSEKPKIRWLYAFIISNCILSWLFAIKYLAFIFPLKGDFKLRVKVFLTFYILLAYISHFAVLMILSLSPVILLTLIFSNLTVLAAIAIIISTVSHFFLIIDSLLFSLYRFHLNSAIFKMIFSREITEIFALSLYEWITTILLFAIILATEVTIAIVLWRRAQSRCAVRTLQSSANEWGRKFVYTIAVCLMFSYLIYALSISKKINLVTQQVKALPYYEQIFSVFIPLKNSLSEIEQIGRTYFYQLKHPSTRLNYPRQALQCMAPTKPYNILFILVDTWRFDSVTEEVMPHINKFAKKNWLFTQHYSGGNGTLPGIFSLLYGLPSPYWTAILHNKQSPVLLTQALKNGYHPEILASAELLNPEFDKTAFVEIDNLEVKSPGNTPGERDRYITKQFKRFLQDDKNKKPFFAYLFYDAAHAYCQPQDFDKPFQPAVKKCYRIAYSKNTDPIPYLNRYKNSLHFIDKQIGSLLHLLEKQQRLQNTIIIISGDHGQEFNDNKQNYWEHASNFTDHQVRTPLIIHWPNEKEAVFNHASSHYDIVPTLLSRVFNCSNAYADYSIGHDILTPHKLPYHIVGSYINFGFIEKDTITTILTNGRVLITDRQANPLPQKKLNNKHLHALLSTLRRYYQ